MEHSTQVKIARELLSHIDDRTTTRVDSTAVNDATNYTSNHVLKLERKKIFGEYPLVAALSVDLPTPGSFLTEEFTGTPVLLARGEDGVVRAFLNACRHRGSRLVNEPQGQRLRFSCPFHAWSYDAFGQLVGIPYQESFGPSPTCDTSLIELPTAEKHGLIWLSLSPKSTIKASNCLGGLDRELESWHLDTKHPINRKKFTCNMNWKLANDTFGETYHFPFLHRETLGREYYGNIISYETFGKHHRMVFATRTIDQLRDLPQAKWRLRPHVTIAYFLFPNTQLLISRSSIAMYQIFPERLDQTTVIQSVYLDAPPTSTEEKVEYKRVLERLDKVILGEDFSVAESAQAGLTSGLLPHVSYGRNEPALHHYHETFANVLGAEVESHAE